LCGPLPFDAHAFDGPAASPHAGPMAPMTDTVVDDLKNTVHKLEQRIAELESRLSGHGGSSAAAQESVRMILMGPPGAGELRTEATRDVHC
jgi:hypothetical protein